MLRLTGFGLFESGNDRDSFLALLAVHEFQGEHVAAGRRLVAVCDLQCHAVAFALLQFFNQWLDVGIKQYTAIETFNYR